MRRQRVLLLALSGLAGEPASAVGQTGSWHLRAEVGRFDIHETPPVRGDRTTGFALGVHAGRGFGDRVAIGVGVMQGFGEEAAVRGIDPALDRDQPFNFTTFELELEVLLLRGAPVVPFLGIGAGVIRESSGSSGVPFHAAAGIELVVAPRHRGRILVRRGRHASLGDTGSYRGPNLIALGWSFRT